MTGARNLRSEGWQREGELSTVGGSALGNHLAARREFFTLELLCSGDSGRSGWICIGITLAKKETFPTVTVGSVWAIHFSVLGAESGRTFDGN